MTGIQAGAMLFGGEPWDLTGLLRRGKTTLALHVSSSSWAAMLQGGPTTHVNFHIHRTAAMLGAANCASLQLMACSLCSRIMPEYQLLTLWLISALINAGSWHPQWHTSCF